MLTALAADVLRPILIMQADTSAGAVRAWTGVGDLTWDSQTWSGLGEFLQVGSLEETIESVGAGTSIRLSGIPAAYVSMVLSTHTTNRDLKIWFGAVDDAGAVITNPIGPFKYKMDGSELEEGADTSAIVLQAENALSRLKVPNERRYTHEDQKIDYPGDLGFEYVAGLQEKQVTWGKSAG